MKYVLCFLSGKLIVGLVDLKTWKFIVFPNLFVKKTIVKKLLKLLMYLSNG